MNNLAWSALSVVFISFEYENATEKNSISKTYTGVTSYYSNGYMFLDSTVDTSQYETDGIYSLLQTKTENDVSILYYTADSSEYDVVTDIPNQTIKNQSL